MKKKSIKMQKNYKESLALKSIITEMENSLLEGFKGRF